MRSRPLLVVVALVLIAAPVTVASATPQETRELMMTSGYDSRPGSRLVVDVPDADIVLRTGASDRVEVEIWLESRDIERARERFEQMQFNTDGNAGEVRIAAQAVRGFSWWDWRNWGGFTVRVEVTVPEQHDVDIKTSDGDIDVQSIAGDVRLRSSDGDISAERLAGTAFIDTSDGDIVVRSIEADTVEIRTSDGDISLGDLTADSIEIRTSDGDISSNRMAAAAINARSSDGDIVLQSVAGALTAQTNDGSLHVRIESLGPSDLRTSDGNITIEAPASLGAALDLRGNSLDLRSTVSFAGTLERRSAQGDLNGGGPLLKARTGDGRIVLRLDDPR